MDRKQLRKAMSPAGWIMVIYYVLVNACVIVSVLVEALLNMLAKLSQGNLEGIYASFMDASASAWGYFVAAGVGLIILLAWKKPTFWKEEIWAKGRTMKTGDFFGILCLFLSVQVFYQIIVIGLELLLNGMGLTLTEGLETMSAGGDSFSMFLYIGILAPVTEELLCRGLVQRTLMPFGRKLAILGSAFLFGMFHGNILQAPYAFVVGLLLGYVASEYSIAWAMVLHMINNLVLGDMLTRLTAGLGDAAAGLIVWAILLICLTGAVITLVRKRRRICVWMRQNTMGSTYAACFFSSAGVITFTVLMLLSMIGTLFMLITPI